MTPRLYIGIATAESISACTVQALFDATRIGFRLHIQVVRSSLPESRAEIVTAFLESDCDALLHLDADVSIGAETIERLATVGGIALCAYRRRQPPHSWALETGAPLAELRFEERQLSSPPAPKSRIALVKSAGLGCCMVPRAVLEDLCSQHSALQYLSRESGKLAWALYQPRIARDTQGERRSLNDESAFFFRAEVSKHPVACLVDEPVTHAGLTDTLGRYLRLSASPTLSPPPLPSAPSTPPEGTST